LNYKKYFVEGEQKISELDDYTSHNTHRLDVNGVKQLLLKLDFIQEELNA
jgi:UDP-glucose 4-epimerase